MKKLYFLIVMSVLISSTVFAQSRAQRLVLLEEFTNASCGPCASQNPAFNALIDANPTKVVAIKYQTNWPGTDPMNAQNPTQVSTRVSYYSCDGVPYARMDGVEVPNDCNAYAGAPACLNQTEINTEYAVSSPFTMTLTHYLSDDLDSIYISVSVTAESAVSGTLKLHNVIIEREINFTSPPGSNGETEFFGVMRKMLPSDQGEALSNFTAGQTVSYSYGIPIPTYIYDKNQLAVVCFVQDNADKSVKQAAYSAPIPLALDAAITSLSNVPLMQCTSTFDPSFVLQNTGSTALTSATIEYKIDNNTPSTYAWTGNLALNATATINLPTITGTAGSHTFTVSVTEVNGVADVNAGNNSKSAPFTIATTGSPAPITEQFTATTFPPTGWIVNNPDAGPTWTRKTGAGAASTTSCAKVDFYNSTNGNQDDLIIKPLDFTGISAASLTFYVAYAQYQSENDRIQVQVSTDCGTTWATKWEKAGSTLSTAAATTSSFTPTSAQWRQETVSLSTYDGQNNVFIRFHAISNYGNNGYVDEINISGTTAIENTVAVNKDIMIYPNPTDGLLYIYNAENAEISLYNILGQKILSVSKATNVNTLDLSGLQQGNYFVKISNGKEVVTKKVVLTK